MEPIKVLVGDEACDKVVHGAPEEEIPLLPQFGDTMVIAAKPNATAKGRPGVVVSFTTQLPDGTVARVQAVTTAALFLSAAKVIENHPDLQ